MTAKQQNELPFTAKGQNPLPLKVYGVVGIVFKMAHEIISHSYWVKITDCRGLNYTELAFQNVSMAF